MPGCSNLIASCRQSWPRSPETGKRAYLYRCQNRPRSEHHKWHALARAPLCACASPYAADTLGQVRAAAVELHRQGAQLLIMDCIGYAWSIETRHKRPQICQSFYPMPWWQSSRLRCCDVTDLWLWAFAIAEQEVCVAVPKCYWITRRLPRSDGRGRRAPTAPDAKAEEAAICMTSHLDIVTSDAGCTTRLPPSQGIAITPPRIPNICCKELTIQSDEGIKWPLGAAHSVQNKQQGMWSGRQQDSPGDRLVHRLRQQAADSCIQQAGTASWQLRPRL